MFVRGESQTMKFNDKTKRIICLCVVIAMALPIGISIAYMFIGQ